MKKLSNIPLLTVLLLLLVSILLMVRNREYFAIPIADNEVLAQKNPTDNIWDRQEIQDSLPIDYIVQYPNTYYYELSNEEFLNALTHTFIRSMIQMNGAEWTIETPVDRSHIPPKDISSGYNLIVPWLEEKINSSGNFNIPGDKTAPFQIIHDYWKSWSSSIFIPNRFLYTVDVLIFREAKNHAKHTSFKIVVENEKIKGIIEMGIVGIVFEDKFGLFPVSHSDKTDLENLYQPYDANPLASNPSTLIDDNVVNIEIDKRERDNKRVEKINKYLQQTTEVL